MNNNLPNYINREISNNISQSTRGDYNANSSFTTQANNIQNMADYLRLNQDITRHNQFNNSFNK